MSDFAALLLEARTKRGMTQAEVALAAGLTPSYLSFIENRKKPPPSDEVCERLATVLGIPARRLIEVAHFERAPPTVRNKLRSLTRTLRRERRSRLRVLKALLNPFLFAGPPGYLESTVDSLSIPTSKRRRIREVLRALGRRNADHEEEVSRLLEELPERERSALLEALPELLARERTGPGKRKAQGAPRSPTAPEESASFATVSSGRAETSAGSRRGRGAKRPSLAGEAEPPLLYAPPPAGAAGGLYLLELSEAMVAEVEGTAAGDRILVDPAVMPQIGDLVVLRAEEGPRLYRIEVAGELPRDIAGTVVELRRRLRKNR